MQIKTSNDLFNLGMMRNFPDVIPDVKGIVLNLGAGEKQIDGAIPLDWPGWDAETDPIPAEDGYVHMIHAYHFLEHLTQQGVIHTLKECHRVLVPKGHINIVVPYAGFRLAQHDLDHKTQYVAQTWKELFDHDFYTKNKISGFDIAFNRIQGETLDRLCLTTQLVKK